MQQQQQKTAAWYDSGATHTPDPTPNLIGPYCQAQHPEGPVCTRLPLHTGRHAAANGEGFVIAVWP